MRKKLAAAVAVMITVLLPASGRSEPEHDSVRMERICAWVGDRVNLPTEVLEGLAAGEGGVGQGCRAAAACLAEARRSLPAPQRGTETSAPTSPAAVCRRIAEGDALAPGDLQALAAAVKSRLGAARNGDRPPGGTEPSGLHACSDFLACLLRSKQESSEGEGGPTDAGDGHDSWKADFERICAQTEIATSLPEEQLQELIRDADDLLEHLGSLTTPEARVYVFRLKKCRAFFDYALQLRDEGA